MTQEEILEFNKRCSTFLGFQETEIGYYDVEEYLLGIERDNTFDYFDLAFHSDWNWIMVVVDAIRNITNPKPDGASTYFTLKLNVQAALGRVNKEAVVSAINQYLIWYEKNK
jgi:hypothetical protein